MIKTQRLCSAAACRRCGELGFPRLRTAGARYRTP